ncbi:MAG TPA: hypothetical protein VNJ29_02990 [Candidatus Nitrosotenuis sp.]|nr:hypothetical protein [Candidatus Nitrosotenuis sp.]
MATERENLYAAAIEQTKTFDKALLTLSSGAFGVTIAFLKDLVPKPYDNTNWLLAISWLFFSISLVSVVCSYLFSQHAILKQMDLNKQNSKKKGSKDEKNVWTTATVITNWLSLIAFLFALTFWCSFIYWNKFHNYF